LRHSPAGHLPLSGFPLAMLCKAMHSREVPSLPGWSTGRGLWKPFPETRVPATGVLQQLHTPRHPPERRPPRDVQPLGSAAAPERSGPSVLRRMQSAGRPPACPAGSRPHPVPASHMSQPHSAILSPYSVHTQSTWGATLSPRMWIHVRGSTCLWTSWTPWPPHEVQRRSPRSVQRQTE
jgi:hypothetical protein